MLKVGITGGIGSGKSVVCQVFTTLGIPVFNADDAARYLMEHDDALVLNISQLLGNEVYTNGKLNRDKVSAIIYKDQEKLRELNELVHPATISYAKQWIDRQTTPYTIKEAAIFFESGSDKDMDVMVGVQAPQELRIARAMSRGSLTREQVLSIIVRQMDEDEKMSRCDHVIINDDQQAILPQILKLHQLLSANNGTAR
jgi:dephospho-CoA kinase